MFDKIREYYELDVWNEQRVRNAVKRGAITPEQFETITKKEY